MNLIQQIKEIEWRHILKRLKGEPTTLQEKDNYIYYNGVLSLLHPQFGLKKGEKIVTPRGIGEVFKTFPNYGLSLMKNGLFVEVFLPRKYYKSFKYHDVYQYVVWNDRQGRYIPLSNSCYQYVLDANDIVEYRITSRGYAMFSDNEKSARSAIQLFNSHRGGRSILRHLLNEGYKISKP